MSNNVTRTDDLFLSDRVLKTMAEACRVNHEINREAMARGWDAHRPEGWELWTAYHPDCEKVYYGYTPQEAFLNAMKGSGQ